jgi:hypothetical protein
VRRISKRSIAVFVGVMVVLASAGVAFAYWTNSGTGTGTASTGTNAGITVVQTSPITNMGPGVAAQTLSGNFNNTNSGPVYVNAVTATITGTDKPGCGVTDYTIAGTAPVNVEVPAGAGVGSWTGLTIAFNNKPAVNQDACKNAVVTIAYATS